MKICTINVPETYIEAIAKLVGKDGLYPSRSELVRVAVREFLIKELRIAETMKRYGEESNINQEGDEGTNYVRVPINKKDSRETSEALESIIVFNNPFYDEVLQCLIKNKIFISPNDLARQIDISTETATEQLQCLQKKYKQFVKERNGEYKVNTYFLKEYLRAHNKKEIIQKLEHCLSLLKQDKTVNSPTEYKTYTIIERLEH